MVKKQIKSERLTPFGRGVKIHNIFLHDFEDILML